MSARSRLSPSMSKKTLQPDGKIFDSRQPPGGMAFNSYRQVTDGNRFLMSKNFVGKALIFVILLGLWQVGLYSDNDAEVYKQSLRSNVADNTSDGEGYKQSLRDKASENNYRTKPIVEAETTSIAKVGASEVTNAPSDSTTTATSSTSTSKSTSKSSSKSTSKSTSTSTSGSTTGSTSEESTDESSPGSFTETK